jgi:6-phosphogluconolactonase
MFAPLLLALQGGPLPPQLDLVSGSQAGTELVYQLSGNVAGGGIPEYLFIDFALLPLPFAVDPFGVLYLALTPLFDSLDGDGSHQWTIPVPADPVLTGLVVHAQGFGFVTDGFSGQFLLSNLVSTILTAPEPIPRFVYSANWGDDTVSILFVDKATAKLRHAGFQPVGDGPTDLAVMRNGQYLFVLAAEAKRLEGYGVDPIDGELSPLANPANLGAATDPGRLVGSPDGTRLYVSDRAGGRIAGFAVGVSGSLTPIAGSPWTVVGSGVGSQGTESLAIDAEGSMLFALNRTSNTLSTFKFDGTGALLAEQVTAIDPDSTAVTTLTQDGPTLRALVASRGLQRVTAFTVATDGSATAVDTFDLSPGADPMGLSAGRFLGGDRVYVANAGGDNVQTLALDALGQLSAQGAAIGGPGVLEMVLHVGAEQAWALFAGVGEISSLAVDPTSGALTPVAPLPSPTDRIRVRTDARALAVVSGVGTSKFRSDRAYVAARAGKELSQFSFDPNLSETMALVPSGVATTGQCNDVAVHPRFDATYVANFLQTAGDDLQVYNLLVGGAASLLQSIDLGNPGVSAQWTVDVDPSGSLVLVVQSDNPGQVIPLRVGPLGMLTVLPGVTTGGIPRGADLDPTGRFYYVANSIDNTVSQYRVDIGLGTVVPLVPPTVATGNGPVDVICDPTGRFAYVVNLTGATVSAYNIDPHGGGLTPLGGGTFAAGTRPVSADIDPGGRFLVVADELGKSLRRYGLNLVSSDGVPDGSATLLGVVPLPSTPRAVHFDASGTHLFVSQDVPPPGGVLVDRVSTFSFDAPGGGILTLEDEDASGGDPRGIGTRDRIK